MAFFNVTPAQKIDTLSESFDKGFNTSVQEDEKAPGFFDGAGSAVDGFTSGFRRSILPNYSESNPVDAVRRREISESIAKMRPDPKTVGTLGQIGFSVAEALSFIGTEVLQNPESIASPTLMAMNLTRDYAPAQTEVNIAEGMDRKTAEEVARTQSVAFAAGALLPVSITGNAATRIATGGGLNVLVGAGERAESGRILRANGYEEMAKQYRALDATAATAEFILGGFFGGVFGGRAKSTVRADPSTVLPSDVDAALTGNQSVHATVDTAPGVPVNGRSAQAHTEALNTAVEQLAMGDKVNVENLMTEAGFLGKRPDFDAIAMIRQELEIAGFPDVAAKVRDLELAAKERGLYVEPADLNVVLSDEPAAIKVGGVRGRESEVKIGNDYVPTEFRIMEAADVRATMGKADNQYRDRTRVASEQQITEAARNLDPRLLGDSPVMDLGAPVLTADGKIIAGNGRAAFIERAYETNAGESYRTYLREQSEALGLNASQIDAMDRPVLVRVLKKDVDVNKAAILSNEGGAMGMSALEQSKVDGERLGDFTAFQFTEDGGVSSMANMPFIRAWVEKFPTNQRSRLMDSDGRLSAEGNRRLQNAIMYRAYGDSDTLARLVEATDPGSRNVVAALSRTAARVADAKEAIARGDLYPFDLSGDILLAVEKLDSLKRSGQSVTEWVNQIDGFGDGMTGEARALVVMMDRNIRSSRAIGDAIDGYYTRLEALGDPKQGSMFEAATPTKQDVFSEMLDEGEVMYSRNTIGDRLKSRIANDFDGAAAEYSRLPDSDNGRILNTDLARELSPEYRGDRTRSAEVHEAASAFVKKLYTENLAQPTPAGRDNVVMFTAGGTGAGKTTGLNLLGEASQRPEIIYDTNMNRVDSAAQKINQALEAGRNVFISYVFRDPVDALVAGALPRAMRMGRTVPITDHANTHAGVAETIPKLMEMYADDPRVKFAVIDNSRGKDQAQFSSVDKIQTLDYNGLKEKLYAAAKAEYEAGRISEAVYRGTVGDEVAGIRSDARGIGAEDRRGNGGLDQQEGARTTVSDLTDLFRAQFGRDADRLLDVGRIRIVQSVSDLPVLPNGLPHPPNVGGMYQSASGTSFIVADTTKPSELRGRVLHEIGVHSGFEDMLGAPLYADVLTQVEARIASGDGRFLEARRLAIQNAAKPEHIPQETLAYLVENAPEMPLARRILAAVRQWLYRTTGGRFVDLTRADLVAMTSASLRRQARLEAVGLGGDGVMYQATRVQDVAGKTAEIQPDFSFSKRAPDTEAFYQNAKSDANIAPDEPLPTTLIPTGERMEPISLATERADADVTESQRLEPGFMSAVECALVAGE